MTTQNQNTSHKTFQINYEDRTRKILIPYDPATHKKFNPETMFHTIWNTSNFYDLFLNGPYLEMTFFGQDNSLSDAVNEYENIGKQGFFGKQLSMPHRVLFGDWDGDRGSALLVPVNSRIKVPKDLGLDIVIRSKVDKPKVRKYMRRLHAHHEWAVAGKVTGTFAVPTGQVVSIKTGDYEFDVLHTDLESLGHERNEALADGIHLVDIDLLQYLGQKFDIPALQRAEIGDCFKGTMLSMLGLGKGFFHVVNMKTYGIIIYGPKKQITFDKFFFGSLGDVKGGAARTCMQSIGCFISEETKELWVNQMILFVTQLMEAVHDEKKLKHMFLTTVGSIEDTDLRGEWVLIEAIRHGVPILGNPGLFRRVVRFLMTKVLDCGRGRIPYGDVAHRYNLMPDLSCFDFESGLVDYRKSVIPENAICCMDAGQGPFAMYRQPLGNAREAVVTTNIHNRRFRRYIGRERVILGISALEQLRQMGGGDFDDSVIGTDNLSWIEVIAAADYPVTELPEAEAQALNTDVDEDNMFLNGGTVKIGNRTVRVNPVMRQYPTTWTKQDYFEAGAEAFDPQLSIGPVDNAVRLDLMLSGVHKDHMLGDLAKRIDKSTGREKETLIKAFHWLEDREDFQLREVGSNLESFIDFVKMRKGDETVIAHLTSKIQDLAKNTMVFPECWTWLGGRGGNKGRIPQDRKDAQDYVLAPSLTCHTLKTIRDLHAKLMEALKEEEWTMVQRIPQLLSDLYPKDAAVADEARELRISWREWWMPFIAGEALAEGDTVDKQRAFTKRLIMKGGVSVMRDGTKFEIEGVDAAFNKWRNEPGDDPESDLRLAIAVEIARQTYRNRHAQAERGDDGRRRGFADGLLWTDTIGLFYIQALKYAGLTGLYLPVRFDRHSAHLRSGVVEVKLTGGIVTRKSDNFAIGYVIWDETPEDGEFIMEDGIVTVIEAAPELTQAVTDPDDEINNPITDNDMEVMD